MDQKGAVMERTITIKLTQAEFSGLAEAVAESEVQDDDRWQATFVKHRDRAWAKIKEAWYGDK